MGAPVDFSHRHNGFYYRDPDYALPLLRLSEGELVALFLAERLMQGYRGTPFAKDIATAFSKITAALPEQVSIDLNTLDDALSIRAMPARSVEIKIVRRLVRAVRAGQQVELVYWSASRNATCRRVVDPYHLASVQGDWYLIGYCHLREEIRMFVPGRIRELRETGEHFQRPADFHIGEYLDASFRAMRGSAAAQRVRLRFSSEAARYIREKIWHPSQKVQERKDGSLVLTLRVNHLLEVRRWAMGWGSECEVLEPVELRREVSAELERMRRVYE